MKYFIKTWIIPRLVFVPFVMAKIILIFNRFRPRHWYVKKNILLPNSLCIEAGLKGWESIEFKEIYLSACEYLGSKVVYKVQISTDIPYTKQVKQALETFHPTHYLYDPRTGSQKWFSGLVQSFKISILLNYHGVTPIALLTDLSVRTWRAQSSVITAKSGVVNCFMSPRLVFPVFPHKRLIGPSLMPFSVATFNLIRRLSELKTPDSKLGAIFIGSLYEPRTTTLKCINSTLHLKNLSLEIIGRELGSRRIPDDEYWLRIISAKIVFTTADQIKSKTKDWVWVKQIVYRYLEVLACGTLLVAPELPGLNRYFYPGIHYVPFVSSEDAAFLIEYYLINDNERNAIAKKGQAMAQSLITSRSFWNYIDVALGKSSLL